MVKSLILLILLSIGIGCYAQNLSNIGFEKGNFSNWQVYSGSIDVNGDIAVNPIIPAGGWFTIVGKDSGNVLDKYGGFPVLCPNGSNYSVILNDASAGGKAQRITYTFQVPTTQKSYSIVFNYAVVLQNPSHVSYQQPKFTAFVYDVTDNKYIDCPSFNFVAGSSLPGFKLSTIPAAQGASIFYKPWSTALIDLHSYLGKTIRIEFTVNDCAPGAHFGYAYLDVEENNGSSAAITGNAYCTGQNLVNLVGPTGFKTYDWYVADFSKKIGTDTQNLVISPPPADQTSYALVVYPFNGLGCTDTIFTTVSKINSNYIFKTLDTIRACSSAGVDLTSPAIVAGSDPDLTYAYYSDSLATVYQYNPNHITDSGRYYIKAMNAEGCSAVRSVYITFGSPTQKINAPAPVTFPQTIDLTSAFTHLTGLTYGYFEDAACARPISDPAHIKKTATYYVSISSGMGCTSVDAVNVVVYPPPPYVIKAPNTFTPNGDGVNDLFKFNISGYLVFDLAKIYNRSGELLFTIKNIDQAWDGTFNDKRVSDGVYYWFLEGRDTYNDVKISKGGSITIIR